MGRIKVMTVKRICLLGATGSIGKSTLDLIAQHPDQFELFSASANSDVEGMLRLVQAFKPTQVCMRDEAAGQRLSTQLKALGLAKTELLIGGQGLNNLAAHSSVDTVVAGIVGIAGLLPVWSAVSTGKSVLLANKEALVCAGELFVQAAKRFDARILPIDSEHNAIFQCLGSAYRCFTRPASVRRLLLTASGGPFRQWSPEAIRSATPEQAVKHPNWVMGPKISVDSATMMNKALELIEAHWLFAMPAAEIEVVIHPQSIIHSMVEFQDGSTLAQLGAPDMRTPIAHAMAWPHRIQSSVESLNWSQLRELQFEVPDNKRFPSLEFARHALASGPVASICLNATNEVMVARFLKGDCAFGAIFDQVEEGLSRFAGRFPVPTGLDDVMAIDTEVRSFYAH
jgi:1-deoxy-D-xylulose-5-phosphate reductoisomerase